ncbi:MAG: efflux RND transporter permease subunit [Thermoanaerobaculales bacterium]
MIRRLAGFALGFPGAIILLVAGLVGAGLYCYSVLDIEAYPNPVAPLVEVIAVPDGWSAEDAERQFTVPLEIELSGMPGLDHIRSISIFGDSDVKCYFKWGTSYEQARQEVINRLQFIQLPGGVQPFISPWNAIGEIYRYIVRGNGYPVRDLKTVEDWLLEREFKQVPGVIDVTSFGGETKQYDVDVDPIRLRGYGLTLPQLTAALQNANVTVGGQRVTLGEQSYTVRGLGLIRSVADIRNIVVQAAKGVPVRVRDVAEVSVAAHPRLGMVGKDDDADVVQGIVLMRYGGRTTPTLEGVHRRVEHIRTSQVLPPGVTIEPYYDRGTLVHTTTHTVLENVILGIALVSLVLLLFLGNVRASLITALNIPLALLAVFCGMVISGTPANLISLGAVDFGIIIDSTVIVMENIFRHLGIRGKGTIGERVTSSVSEVGRPMAFSTLIIAVAFLPLFTMTGVSGVIFSPLAHTYAFAIAGAILLALTLTPLLSAQFLRAEGGDEESSLMRVLHRIFNPMFDVVLRHPVSASVGILLPILFCIGLFPLLGREYLPKLEEGNLWIRATLPMSVSLETSSRYITSARQIIRRHPEVITVVSQLGRPDDGTDVVGFENLEFFAPLKSFAEWQHGISKDQLTDQLSAELRAAFPGVLFNFSQYLSDNVEEALSGIKGENSVKVIGPDLGTNERIAREIVEIMSPIPGIKDVGLFTSLGQPSIKIETDRARCDRYGINTGDVEATIQAAIGGQAVTQVLEGEKRFDLVVRWQHAFRHDAKAIGAITVAAPDGASVPLSQLASITEEGSPSKIWREDQQRYAPVKFSIRGRDLAGAINEAKTRIAQKVQLPYGTRLEWAGEINELREAEQRLLVIIPITVLLIVFLVYSATRNGRDSLIVLINIPVACAGGIMALLVTGEHFSVSAAMGFVSIFGIAIQDAILVVTYAQRKWAEGMTVEEGARAAAVQRLRASLMTTLVAMFGLLPAAISRGIGAQAQKPLAIVVIGGALVLAFVTRILQPPLLVLLHRRGASGNSEAAVAGSANATA